ncbi:MAG: hypothetical protein Q7S84_03645 [bacterium]|nr:hypothetical protein [bacterium]
MGTIIHPCEVPGCPIKGEASKMFNLKKLPGKPLVVVCAKHARMARKEGVKAYNLQSTFEYEAERVKEREGAAAFIRAHSRTNGRGYGMRELAKINGNGNKQRKEVRDEKVPITNPPLQETGEGAGNEAGSEGVRPHALAA